MRPVGIGGRRRDAVDHRTREADIGLDPRGEIRIDFFRKGHDGRARQFAIVRQVVAAQNRERRNAGGLAALQRIDDQPEDRLGKRRIGKVGGDGRRLELQLAGRQIEVIALLCHSDADDTRADVAHFGQQPNLFGILGTADRVDDRADNTDSLEVSTELGHRVKAILRRQRVAHAGRLHAGSDDTPGQIAGVKHCFGHQGLMGTMERTQTEMHDRRRYLFTVVGGPPDCGRQLGQSFFGKTHGYPSEFL